MGNWTATIYQVEAGFNVYKICFRNIKTQEERWIEQEGVLKLTKWFSIDDVPEAIKKHRPTS
jgi:hypothetical protein